MEKENQFNELEKISNESGIENKQLEDEIKKLKDIIN